MAEQDTLGMADNVIQQELMSYKGYFRWDRLPRSLTAVTGLTIEPKKPFG
jgi:hypothetical protein